MGQTAGAPTWVLVCIIFAIVIGVVPNIIWLVAWAKKRYELKKAKDAATAAAA